MACVASLFKVSHAISVSSAGFGYKTVMLAYENMPHNKRMQSDRRKLHSRRPLMRGVMSFYKAAELNR